VSAPREIDVAWSVQSDDWPGELPADMAALLAPPVVVSAQAVEPVRAPIVTQRVVARVNSRLASPRPRSEDRHNFRQVVASGTR
jgi:hypothetical protein